MVYMLTADVLVIGSGLAGLRAAIEAASKGVKVIVATKSTLGYASSTLYTSRGFRVPGPEYSVERHFVETLIAGGLINDQELVRIMVSEASKRVMELESFGVKIVRGRRFASVKGWRPVAGLSIVKPLADTATRLGVIPLENVMAVDLLVEDGRVKGAVFYSMRDGSILSVYAKSVILATGGYSQLYIRCDNPVRVTGDGCALALRAGARLVDMEFVQFYPLGLAEEKGPAWLFPAIRGKLVNSRGEDVLAKHGVKSPLHVAAINMRDVVSRIMWMEMAMVEGGEPLTLEFSVEDESDMKRIVEDLGDLARMVDLQSRRVKVAPLAHFTMGGIAVLPDCSTDIKGLYACGEVAGGVHGANRLGGNALTEAAVFGAIAGRSAAEHALTVESPPDSLDSGELEDYRRMLRGLSRGKYSVSELREKLRSLMWNYCGIVRSRESLEHLLGEIEGLKVHLEDVRASTKLETLESLELQNMTLLAEVVAKAALTREESRGAHYREDYPTRDDRRWLKRISVMLRGGSLQLVAEPVKLTYVGLS